jgi:hypothetical protein
MTLRIVAWSLCGVVCAAVVAAAYLLAQPQALRKEPWPAVRFEDWTEKSGVKFFHTTGASGSKWLPETMGSGVAIFDYNGDGHNDILLINSRPWPNDTGPAPTLALYRNNGDGTFTNTTHEAGLDVPLFGMGVAVGDYDNDGRPDLFITALGGNRLFRNIDGKRFIDQTTPSGLGGPGGWPETVDDFGKWKPPLNWSTSAAWLDYDGDGQLDLFVCNYVVWSPQAEKRAWRLPNGERAYGPPEGFDSTQCFLYRNLGNGKFEDVSHLVAVSQHGHPVGKALGVIVGDFDEDGWPDIAVANDTRPNFLFHNVKGPKGRRFEEVGLTSGVGLTGRSPRGAMGIDWAPGFRKGKSALLIGNYADEPNSFLVKARPGGLEFTDLAVSEGIAAPSKPLVKFGLFFLDFDLDGRPDVLATHGHLEPDINRVDTSQQYAQPVHLMLHRNGNHPHFDLATEKEVGPDLLRSLVGRGCAFGDLNGDGIPDIVLTSNGGPARVLLCRNETGNNWLRLRLTGDGKRSNRMAIGARVQLITGDHEQWREVTATRGYLSCSETVLTFGLGDAEKADLIRIYWPGKDAGPPQVIKGLVAGTTHDIEQGR